jgi:cysteine-rich repeat protein
MKQRKMDKPDTPAGPLVSMPAGRRSPFTHAAGSTRRLGIIVALVLGCLTGRVRAATPHLAVSGNLNSDLNGCWEPRADQVNGKDSWSKGANILHWGPDGYDGYWIFDTDLDDSNGFSSFIISTAATPPASGTWRTSFGGSLQSAPSVSVIRTPDSACTFRCGDGITQPRNNETCDDNNTDSGDGCSGQCAVEAGFWCSSAEPSVCRRPVTIYADSLSTYSGTAPCGSTPESACSTIASLPQLMPGDSIQLHPRGAAQPYTLSGALAITTSGVSIRSGPGHSGLCDARLHHLGQQRD